MLTVPKLPERKSLQQLLMSVQSCLTCYELAAAEVRARAGATATIITLAWGIKNTYSLWPMPFPLHSKLLLQLLFVLPWRVLLLLQGKSCAFSWLSMYICFYFPSKIPQIETAKELGNRLMAFFPFSKSIKSNFEKKNPPLWTVNHFKRFLKLYISTKVI